jgi:hypothetical protein
MKDLYSTQYNGLTIQNHMQLIYPINSHNQTTTMSSDSHEALKRGASAYVTRYHQLETLR